MPWIVIIVIIVVVLLAAGALAWMRRPTPAPPPAPAPPPVDEAAERARHRQLDELGTELIHRRVELDMRRSVLGGDADVDAAFSRLQERLNRGEISEDEFEAEKIRLLGG